MENIFDFNRDYILENDRVLLRPLQRDDFDNLLYFSRYEPEIWRYCLVSAAGEKHLRSYIRSALEERRHRRQYAFVVFDKVKQKYAGSTRLCEIDLYSRTVQMGYTWYGREFHGASLNKHCKLLLLNFLFKSAGFERVEFRVDVQNERGIQAVEKLGATREGMLRNCGPALGDGCRRDCFVYSLLREEWIGALEGRLHTELGHCSEIYTSAL